jgi:transposase
MSKHFRPWKIDQVQLLLPSVQDYVPDHLSRFTVALVRESLDLKQITASYSSGLGQPPFDPWMMTALFLRAYQRFSQTALAGAGEPFRQILKLAEAAGF